MTFNLYVYSAVNPGKIKTEKWNKIWKACFVHMTNTDSTVTRVPKVTDNSAGQT